MSKELPILFSSPMVRAILEGRKTQTRRIVKPQPSAGVRQSVFVPSFIEDGHGRELKCPYDADRLWVREEHYRYGHWEEVSGVRTKGGRQKWKFVADTGEVLYEPPVSFRKGRHHKDPHTPAWHKRLARFMPRWASRITLEVVSVRVERLQDISEEDAKAEGVETLGLYPEYDVSSKGKFEGLWNHINGPGSWDANPWGWVITFNRLEP